MKVKILMPVSTGKTGKGDPTKFHKVGSVVDIPDNEFKEMEKLGYVKKALLATKTKENITPGKIK